MASIKKWIAVNRMKKKEELLKRIEFVCVFFLKNYKEITVACIIFGFACMFCYTATEGIAFPLNLSSLPSFLMVLAAVNLLIFFVIVSCAIVPNFWYGSIFSKVYPLKKVNSKENIAIYLKLSGLFLIFAMIIFLLAAIQEEQSSYVTWALVGLSLYIIIRPVISACQIYNVKSKQERKNFAAFMLLYNLLSFFWAMVLTIVLSFILDAYSDLGKYEEFIYYFCLIVFVFITHYRMTAPYTRLEDIFPKEKFFLFFVVILLIIPTHIGHHFTATALRILKRGGYYPIAFKIKEGSNLPEEIYKDKRIGLTHKLYMVLDGGDVIHLKLDKQVDQIYSIKSDLIHAWITTKPKKSKRKTS